MVISFVLVLCMCACRTRMSVCAGFNSSMSMTLLYLFLTLFSHIRRNSEKYHRDTLKEEFAKETFPLTLTLLSLTQRPSAAQTAHWTPDVSSELRQHFPRTTSSNSSHKSPKLRSARIRHQSAVVTQSPHEQECKQKKLTFYKIKVNLHISLNFPV